MAISLPRHMQHFQKDLSTEMVVVVKRDFTKFQFKTNFGRIHVNVIKWKHFPRYWPLVKGIHRSPVVSFPSQRSVTRGLDVFFHLRLNNGRANIRYAGDLRRRDAHCDVTVMLCILLPIPGYRRHGWLIYNQLMNISELSHTFYDTFVVNKHDYSDHVLKGVLFKENYVFHSSEPKGQPVTPFFKG